MYQPDDSQLRYTVEEAIRDYDGVVADYRKAVAGEDFTRSDGTTYSYATPTSANSHFLDNLKKSETAASWAKRILDYEDGADVSLIEAARHIVTTYKDTLDSWDRGYRNQGSDRLITRISEHLDRIDGQRDKRVRLHAEKFASLKPRVDSGGALLLDPEIRVTLPDAVIESLHKSTAHSIELIDGLVEADLIEAAEEARIASEARQEALAAKQAKQCQARGSSYRSCEKAGRYLVTYDTNGEGETTKLVCGTHLNSDFKQKRYGRGNGYYGYGYKVLKVVDTKDNNTVIFEKEAKKEAVMA